MPDIIPPTTTQPTPEQLSEVNALREKIQKNVLPKLGDAISKLRSADEVSDEAFKAHVALRISNLEKVCVLDGATLALSFSGISTIKSALPAIPIHVHTLVSIAWVFFIGSIALSLTSNWLAVLSVRSKHHYRSFHKIGEVIVLLQQSMSSITPPAGKPINDPSETRAKSDKKYAFWQNTEKTSDRMGWAAQFCTIAGLVLLCVFFIENMH
jgi:hypothetical protein